MKNNLLLFLLLVSMLLSCSSDDENILNIESCHFLNDAEVLEESELATTCNFLMVYDYNGELYRICECCDCDKTSIPVDCEDNALCDDQDNDFVECLNTFYKEAQYLYSVSI